MKKPIIWFLSILFLSALLRAQTLDEILALHYQAHGGLDKLKAMKAVKMSGKIVIQDQGVEMPMTLWWKTPDKMRTESTFQDKVIVQACDGRQAWWIMPFMAPDAREMSQEQGRYFTEQAFFENPLVEYKEKSFTLELLGKVDLEGISVFKLKLIKTDGREIYFYLDVASSVMLKSTMVLKSGANPTINEILFTNYKLEKGLLMPFQIENKTNGKTQAQLTLATVEINPVIDDAIFAMPLKKEKPMDAGQK